MAAKCGLQKPEEFHKLEDLLQAVQERRATGAERSEFIAGAAAIMELSLTHWAIVTIIVVILFGKRLPPIFRSLRKSMAAFNERLAESGRRGRTPPPRIELVIGQRDSTMTERFKKFLWTPQFWAVLGILGCTTGLYFQRVAANGTGLWCLGLMFFGAAYLEQNP